MKDKPTLTTRHHAGGARPTERDMQSRAQLIAAAKFVFERDGFHDARIVDVAAAAKVGVGTFYRHFPSKVDAFCAVIADTFDEIYVGGATRSLTPDDTAAQIAAANRRFFQQYRRHAKLHALLEQLAPIDEQVRQIYLTGRARATDRIARSIASMQAVGQATADLDAAQAARLLVAMTNNYAHLCFSLGEGFDEELALATLNRLWIDGIGLRSGSDTIA